VHISASETTQKPHKIGRDVPVEVHMMLHKSLDF